MDSTVEMEIKTIKTDSINRMFQYKVKVVDITTEKIRTMEASSQEKYAVDNHKSMLAAIATAYIANMSPVTTTHIIVNMNQKHARKNAAAMYLSTMKSAV